MPDLSRRKLLYFLPLFLALAAGIVIAAQPNFSIQLNTPPNDTATTDPTPTFNFTVTGQAGAYHSELKLCYPNETLASYNSTGALMASTDCTTQCYNSTHSEQCQGGQGCSLGEACSYPDEICTEGQGCNDLCVCDESKQDYLSLTINGDTVYVDCINDKCWSPTADSKYDWSTDSLNPCNDDCTCECPECSGYQACNYCDNLEQGGFTDWRLPTKNTLSNLCSDQGSTPFGEGYSDYYWSSTEYDSYDAYLVDFSNCDTDYYYKVNSYYVRCVRA